MTDWIKVVTSLGAQILPNQLNTGFCCVSHATRNVIPWYYDTPEEAARMFYRDNNINPALPA